ncbi:MAG: hypothetical protein QMB94_12460 [Phycisphaerales bacterium]
MSLRMPETEMGYIPPTVRQFSVFLDNRVGKMLELLEMLEEAADVHVRATCVLDSSDHAVVRVLCDNADGARFALRQNGFTFSEMDILIFELVTDASLREALRFLLAAEVNIAFTYPVNRAGDVDSAMAIAVDDHTFAGQILLKKGFSLLGELDLT